MTHPQSSGFGRTTNIYYGVLESFEKFDFSLRCRVADRLGMRLYFCAIDNELDQERDIDPLLNILKSNAVWYAHEATIWTLSWLGTSMPLTVVNQLTLSLEDTNIEVRIAAQIALKGTLFSVVEDINIYPIWDSREKALMQTSLQFLCYALSRDEDEMNRYIDVCRFEEK